MLAKKDQLIPAKKDQPPPDKPFAMERSFLSPQGAISERAAPLSWI
jgi:hypothetical protein